MQITKLEYQKNNSDRVNVFVDGKFSFALNTSQIISLGIVSGQELTSVQLQSVMSASDYGFLLSSALNFLSFRQRSEWEIKQYLLKKIKSKKKKESSPDPKENNGLVENIINKLRSLKMTNDEEFAKWLIESRRGSRPKGKMAIEMELSRKGIDREIVHKLLNNSTEDKISELELAKRALGKKAEKLLLINDDKKASLKEKDRLLRFLLSKGFNWEVAQTAVEEVVKKE